MARYASKTSVPVSRSKQAIEDLLVKGGATEYVCGFTPMGSAIMFTIEGVRVRIFVPLEDDAQEERRRWRAALLILKAKLEVIQSGDSTVGREFMADVMLPGGGTLGERMLPELADALNGKPMPRLLP